MSDLQHDEQIARALVERLHTVFDLQRVVWFGSRAQGTGGPDSDWDLLVVAETPLGKLNRMTQALAATEDLLVPRDIFVATPSEFERQRHQCGSLVYAAERAGQVLYGR
jgi:predicted nucleotidyltransferase